MQLGEHSLNMILFLTVACTVFVFSAAQPHPPQHCCTPDKWEGHASAIGGFYKDSSTVGRFHIYMRQHYDASDKKLAQEIHETINGEEPGRRRNIISDYDAMRQYVIDADNKCTYHALTEPFERFCIPAHAQHLATLSYGGPHHKLLVNDWNITIGSMNLHRHITVQGCYPVLETFTGMFEGTQVVGGTHFPDITDGIADPKVFEPPADCTPGEKLSNINVYDVLSSLIPRGSQQKPVVSKLPRFDRL